MLIGNNLNRMDAYKKHIIELVRRHPLIWDPGHTDYKSKDQRRLAWEEIDAALPSPVPNVTAKIVWDHLTRGFANALKRRAKRSGTGLGNDVEWKFEADLGFLLPAKKTRLTTSNLLLQDDLSSSSSIKQDNDLSHNYYSPDNSPQTQQERYFREGTDCASEDGADLLSQQEAEIESENENEIEAGFVGGVTAVNDSLVNNPTASHQQTLFKRKRELTPENKTIDYDNSIRKQREIRRCSRLDFFKSLMPVVDSLTDLKFLDFQMDVLQSLKRHKTNSQQ